MKGLSEYLSFGYTSIRKKFKIFSQKIGKWPIWEPRLIEGQKKIKNFQIMVEKSPPALLTQVERNKYGSYAKGVWINNLKKARKETWKEEEK